MMSQTQQLYTHAAQPRAVQQRKAKVGGPSHIVDDRGRLGVAAPYGSRCLIRTSGSAVLLLKASTHQQALPHTPQYREDEEHQQAQQAQQQQQQQQQQGSAVPQLTLLLNPANIMFDRRVVRGSTHHPVLPQQMPNLGTAANSSSQ
jgi:hypothetical protein